MKKLFTFFLAIILPFIAFGQLPQRMSYQAVIRNTSNQLVTTHAVGMKITILKDAADGTEVYSETHTATSNAHGIVSIEIGGGIPGTGVFTDIDWSTGVYFVKTDTDPDGGTTYTVTTTSQLLSVPFALVADDLNGPVDKLKVVSETEDDEEALFEVINKLGQTIFAVYNEGVRIFVYESSSKGSKGGFAIGGFGATKAYPQDLLIVNTDSIRAYIDTDTTAGGKGKKGGFAVGGFGSSKTEREEFLRVTRDSTRVYLNDTGTKGAKGGFAIGGFGVSKENPTDILYLDADSTRFFVRKDINGSSTFDIIGYDESLVRRSLLNANADTVNIQGVLSLQNDLIVGGNIEIGGNINNFITDIDGNNYSTVTIAGVEWLAENLRTTKYNDGTPIPNVFDPMTWETTMEGAYSDYNNDPVYSASHGRLYNWFAASDAKNVCPTGWHVPTFPELETFAFAIPDAYPPYPAKAIAAVSGWATLDVIEGDVGDQQETNNASGFNGLPTGIRMMNGAFSPGADAEASWWSSTEYVPMGGYYMNILFDSDTISVMMPNNKNTGYSIRCMKD